jgi:uncharacterized repeat protein (TIGR01451 family)
MKDTWTTSRSIRVAMVLALLLLTVASTGFAQPGVEEEEGFLQLPDYSDLFKKVAEEGFVRVIAGLRLPKATFTPEGTLTSSEAVEAQRQLIATTRDALLGSLADYSAEAYASWESLPYVALKVDAEALEQLINSRYVTTVQEDSLSRPHLASATAHIGADVTWDAGYGGLGQTVVILDTGIDADHPFFGGRVVHEACFSAGAGGQTLCPGGGNTQTGLGSADALTAQCLNGTAQLCDHGSHVAGIAAGQDPGPPNGPAGGYNGIAPEANIIAIQVFTRFNGAGDCAPGAPPCVLTWDSDQLSALNYVNTNLRPNWSIASVNMSLGGGMNTSACDGDARKAAIDNLLSNGIATVISSGNEDWTDALGAPGCISTAVTVGNVFDPSDDVTDNIHAVVDLLAAGRNVDSSVPDDTYGNKSGTSMAAPQVTGAFAMIKAIDPSMSVGDILSLLQTTGVLVRDNRPPNPANANAGHVKPRIQLDAAVAAVTEANLRVFKDCKPDDAMLVGDTATCTIVVENLGPDAAIAVSAIDQYVSNGTFEFGTVTTAAGTCTATPNPQMGSGTVTCELGGMAAGASVTIQIQVTADEPQNINDRVSVSSITPDPDPANNVAEDEVNVTEIADLQVFKECNPDEPLLAGEEATCTITVKNWGPSTAVNVMLHDIHLSDGTFEFGTVTTTAGSCVTTPNPQVGSGEVNCTLGDMAPGAEVTVVVPVSAMDGMDINDTATVSSDTYDPDHSNNTASDGITVTAVADLALSKTATPNPVMAGTQLTYDLEVTNNGPSTAVNVVIEDVLPTGVTIDTVSSSAGSCNAGVPGNAALPTTCTFDSLAPGSTETMQIVVSVEPQILGILGNNARVYGDGYDPDNSNNLATTATTVQASADLMVAKSDFPDPVLAGEMLSYDVTIQNHGPSTAVDVMLTDVLPDEVSYMGYTISNGSGTCVRLYGPFNTVECDLNDLDPGAFVTVFIEVLVDASVPDGTTITNLAAVSSVTPDPDASNNSATEETTVLAEADLSITKGANFLTDNPSRRIAYTVEIVNSGPSYALEVVMVDSLPLTPQKIVYIMDSGNGACAYDESSHEVTCSFGTLADGESATVDIIVDARGSVDRITNVAVVSSSTVDPDTANNTAIKEIRVKGGPGIE